MSHFAAISPSLAHSAQRQARLVDYATRAVPRYTSYPTAPHFSDRVDCDAYGAWLGALPRSCALSIYLHVPFCRTICSYCGCHTKAARRDGPIHAYAGRLAEELDLVLEHLGPGRRLIHVHWGGGTPSILAAADFLGLVEAITDGLSLTPDAEHAIELDPRTVTPQLARLLGTAGINRVSLGVQDFDPTVQAAIGRRQPFDQVRRAVSDLRDNGIEALSFDLMYGLPHQTSASLQRTVELAAGLAPQRIALFGYAHVPWLKKHQRLIDTAALAGAEERFSQAETAAAALKGHGYERIGLDHFARLGDRLLAALHQGRLRRNFQGYTSDPADVLIGLGASSIGRLPQAFVQNTADVAGWSRAVGAGRLPVCRAKTLSQEDRLRGDIIERLMCYLTVDVSSLARQHGLASACLADAFEALEPLRRDGLIELSGSRLTIPEEMRALARIVAAAFDAYLEPGQARHSLAV